MSRGSKKRKKRQEAKVSQSAKRNDAQPLRNDAMEQALRAALKGQGEAPPERTNRSFGAAMQDIGRRIFGGQRQHPGAPTPPIPRGANTQFLRRTGQGDVELVIGLDFGTSCTKVIIQDIARQTAYAVPFARETVSTGSYLLPTVVHLDDGGVFRLVGPGTEFRGLKEHLMSLAGNEAADEADKRKDLLPHVYAYLALVFREVRAWFMEEHEDKYRGREILWRVNVGLPASRYDQQHMPELYKSTVRRAWYLSIQPAPVSAGLATAVRQLAQVPDDKPGVLGRESVEAFPEVVAAVQGYAKSPQRGDGMYLLVDVGATTLDVTCFRLLNYAHEDKFPMFCASVRPLGGFELFKYRTRCIEALVREELDRYGDALDGVTEPPNPLEVSIALDDRKKIRINGDFRNRVGQTIGGVISDTKKRGDPSAIEWKTRLPVFLIGGASGMRIYREALDLIDNNSGWIFKLDYKDLHLPGKVEAPGTGPAIQQRLIVAYGLSFSQLDFATLIPPSGIPDPEPILGSPRPEIPDFSKEAAQ